MKCHNESITDTESCLSRYLQAEYELLKTFAGEEGKCLEYIEWTLGEYMALIKYEFVEASQATLIVFYGLICDIMLHHVVVTCLEDKKEKKLKEIN